MTDAGVIHGIASLHEMLDLIGRQDQERRIFETLVGSADDIRSLLAHVLRDVSAQYERVEVDKS